MTNPAGNEHLAPLDLSWYMYYNEMRERQKPFPHFLILEEILHESIS